MAHIDEKILEHLYTLSRIEPEKDEKKRKKLIKDIESILDHFNELENVDTSNIEPLSGGSFLSGISRDDVSGEDEYKNIKDQFSDSENGYMKIPPIF